MGRKSLRVPDIWGGLECSFNRVDDLYMDQLQMCGHYDRVEPDIDRIAALGIKAIRYPIIWERHQPQPGQSVDFEETVTRALDRLRSHGITPIAGLVHHGSGPPYSDFLSDAFAPALSSFAGKVARKFPWIEHYTPVNEPLTTARFGALYGFWYPHQNSDAAFARALVNEMKAVVLSMKEIRKINPAAKLVQTEDLAKVYSTPNLRYQAEFENHRRWLTGDFLCGMLTREHPLWPYFLDAGIGEDELKFFIDNPCPPDILGVDYYATSERYLDEVLEQYPPETRGGNHFERYADVEALRVRLDEPHGIKVLLRECWDRYHLPIAVTEVHIDCDYENQIRWFAQIRNACIALIKEDVDIRAVTAWSLLGSFGWNRLLTVPDGEYESGVFDIRSGVPVSTPMAEYLTKIAHDSEFIHPAQLEKGWWEREDRLHFVGTEIFILAINGHAKRSEEKTAAEASKSAQTGPRIKDETGAREFH